MRLLFVCTGNLCRSPMAERLTLARARQAVGDGVVWVTSAGLEAAGGEPMHPHSAAALQRLGGNPAGFRSRPFQAAEAADADLVLTMTRRHRTEVLMQAPRGLRRTFTLLEAADLLERADPSGLADLPLDERARELGLRLDAARAFRPSTPADDLADPIGGRAATHREAAETIAAALNPLTGALFGVQRPVQATNGGVAIPA